MIEVRKVMKVMKKDIEILMNHFVTILEYLTVFKSI